MLDIRLILEKTEVLQENLNRRPNAPDLDPIVRLGTEKKQNLAVLEDLRHQNQELAASIGKALKEKHQEEAERLKEESLTIKTAIRQKEACLVEIEDRLKT